MTLDPAIAQLLASVAGTTPYNEMSVDEARASSKAMGSNDGLEQVASVEDRRIDGVPTRIYRARHTAEDAPIFIWFHGGGFVLGDVDRAEPVTRRLANRLSARLVSVDYRLAPEHPYPAGLEDGRTVVAWALAQQVPVAVGGDSAGANIAARLAVEARDDGHRLRHQVLIYPWLDLMMGEPSIKELAEGFYLTKPLLEWFAGHYLPEGTDRSDPTVSPLHTADLSGVAPATVFTAAYDPLRDEGNRYAERLREAGVRVAATCYPGMIHGFFGFLQATPVAAQAIDAAATNVQADLAGASTSEVKAQ